jgi:hypothetical protein
MFKFFRMPKRSRDLPIAEDRNGCNDSTNCRICSSYESKKTGRLMLSSCEWDFYYCYKCKNWFQVAERDNNISAPVREDMVKTLNAYYVICLQEMEVIGEATGLVHSFMESARRLFCRFCTRYLCIN